MQSELNANSWKWILESSATLGFSLCFLLFDFPIHNNKTFMKYATINNRKKINLKSFGLVVWCRRGITNIDEYKTKDKCKHFHNAKSPSAIFNRSSHSIHSFCDVYISSVCLLVCRLFSKYKYWLLIFFEKIFKKNIYPKSMIKSLLKWIVYTIHNAGRMFVQWMCLNLDCAHIECAHWRSRPNTHTSTPNQNKTNKNEQQQK